MNLANKVTTVRIILAPVFFAVYFLHKLFPSVFGVTVSSGSEEVITGAAWTVPVLWALFIVTEITDMLDGMIARKRGELSDFGKLYDPFADTLTQITYFFCFVIDGILPAVLFLAVLYREFSISFIRNQMLKKGIAMGARMGGKIKTVTYIAAGALALMASSALRLGWNSYRGFAFASATIFIVSVVIALLSFLDYLFVYYKTPKT